MPHRARPLLVAVPMAAVLLTLGACGRREADRPTQTGTASISFSAPGGAPDTDHARSVSVSVPGFAAKLNVPGLSIGSDMTIDGIPFRPETRIGGITITGAAGDGSGGEGHGTVDMRFADPATPDQVLGYYRDAAKRGGWTEVPPAAGQQFAATKHADDGTEHLAIQVGAAATGSAGRFLVSGS